MAVATEIEQMIANADREIPDLAVSEPLGSTCGGADMGRLRAGLS
jgi:hypothetical protein